MAEAAAAMAGGAPALRSDEAVLGRRLGGFSFDLGLRNEMTMRAGAKPPKALKTGTTIVGVVFNGGVVLGADTRATEDTVVADKNCEKIHYIADNIHCCGAGTAADTESITQLVSSNMELLRLQTRRQPRVVAAMTMLKRRLFKYQGHVSAALVLGGVDHTGAHLYSVYPHGSTDKLPFVTMGSGSLAAMAVMETGYKDDLTEEEAKALVARAIRAGIFNDLGSGSNVDLRVIRSDGKAEDLRNYETPNDQSALRALVSHPASVDIPLGATEYVKEFFKKHVVVETVRAPEDGAAAAAGGDEEGDEAMGEEP